MDFFQIESAALTHLQHADVKMAAAIEQIGPIQRAVLPDLFTALCNSIIGQQISSAALATVWTRFCDLVDPLTAQTLLSIPTDVLRACGLSGRKVEYLQSTAAVFASGAFSAEMLITLPDEDFCTALSTLRGVGRWTAEMLLIFCLQRPNVISYDDLGIRRGLRMLYRHRVLTPALFQKYQRRYAPYGTTASLYLWAIAGGALPALTDPAPSTKLSRRARA